MELKGTAKKLDELESQNKNSLSESEKKYLDTHERYNHGSEPVEQGTGGGDKLDGTPNSFLVVENTEEYDAAKEEFGGNVPIRYTQERNEDGTFASNEGRNDRTGKGTNKITGNEPKPVQKNFRMNFNGKEYIGDNGKEQLINDFLHLSNAQLRKMVRNLNDVGEGENEKGAIALRKELNALKEEKKRIIAPIKAEILEKAKTFGWDNDKVRVELQKALRYNEDIVRNRLEINRVSKQFEKKNDFLKLRALVKLASQSEVLKGEKGARQEFGEKERQVIETSNKRELNPREFKRDNLDVFEGGLDTQNVLGLMKARKENPKSEKEEKIDSMVVAIAKKNKENNLKKLDEYIEKEISGNQEAIAENKTLENVIRRNRGALESMGIDVASRYGESTASKRAAQKESAEAKREAKREADVAAQKSREEVEEVAKSGGERANKIENWVQELGLVGGDKSGLNVRKLQDALNADENAKDIQKDLNLLKKGTDLPAEEQKRLIQKYGIRNISSNNFQDNQARLLAAYEKELKSKEPSQQKEPETTKEDIDKENQRIKLQKTSDELKQMAKENAEKLDTDKLFSHALADNKIFYELNHLSKENPNRLERRDFAKRLGINFEDIQDMDDKELRNYIRNNADEETRKKIGEAFMERYLLDIQSQKSKPKKEEKPQVQEEKKEVAKNVPTDELDERAEKEISSSKKSIDQLYNDALKNDDFRNLQYVINNAINDSSEEKNKRQILARRLGLDVNEIKGMNGEQIKEMFVDNPSEEIKKKIIKDGLKSKYRKQDQAVLSSMGLNEEDIKK